MKRRLFTLLGVFSCLTFVSCSSEDLDVKVASSKSIEGQIKSSSLSSLETSFAACSETQVKLYELDSSGKIKYPPKATTSLDSSGQFSLESSIPVTRNTVKGSFVIQVAGCDEILARLVTRSTNQDLSTGSTLIAYAMGTSGGQSIQTAVQTRGGDDLDRLIASLESAESVSGAYDLLRINPTLVAEFQSLFKVDPDALEEAAPLVDVVSFPSLIEENQSYTIKGIKKHWYNRYNPVSKWFRSGSLQTASDQFTLTTTGNDSADDVLFVFEVGDDDGMGDINTSKDYHQVKITKDIINSLFPVSPPISLGSAPVSRSAGVSIIMNTGAALINCDSFENLAITEVNIQPNESEFTTQNLTCVDPNTQIITYALMDRTSGPKTLYLWAQDSDGNISETPTTVSMTLDSGAPYLSFSSPAAGSSHAGSVTITGGCEEPFNVVLSGTGAQADVTLSCNPGGVFSGTVNFTAGTGTKNITISQTDLAANTNSANRNFNNTTP